jgi:flagellar M-ring protein FliF
MKKLLASFSTRQRITIALAAVMAGVGLYSLVQWRQEADFRPLYTGLAPEDAGGVVQKLKESGVEYRLGEGGTSILAPSERIAELRISMAAAGLPKSGRIGFELFDKANLGATDFTEHVNYGRALEGELERSVMSLAAVEQARVHVTFSKESVFVEQQQPAKASVLVRLRPGAHLAPQNVAAIENLVASAVEGLSPDAVSVLDMNGNLLGRPKAAGGLDGPEPSEAVLDYRRKVEADLVAKMNATLEPLLGAERFRAGASVDCDFTGGEQSEEIFDPARSVMVSSQRTEDTTNPVSAGGVPGTAATLPRPTSRAGSGGSRVSRVTENIAYQTSRTVKKSRMPAGEVKKMSLAVLVDQTVSWEKAGGGFRRVLTPPAPEQLKAIHDLVAGVTGLNTDRGDQLIVETMPFEITLLTEPPQAGAPAGPLGKQGQPLVLDKKTLEIGGGAALLLVILVVLLMRRRGAPAGEASAPGALPAPSSVAAAQIAAPPGPDLEHQLEAKLAEREAQQQKLDAQALSALKLAPAITKTSEVLAKHLREKIKEEAGLPAHVLQSWIREDGNY